MTPREIDALVAIHVMGWKIRETTIGKVLADTGDGPVILSDHPSVSRRWHYSTDPAASKQLRDHMRGKGWNYRITRNAGGSQAVLQRGTHSEGWGYAEADSDTEESAFALAALSAVGKPVTK